jgi:hypothetical protein
MEPCLLRLDCAFQEEDHHDDYHYEYGGKRPQHGLPRAATHHRHTYLTFPSCPLATPSGPSKEQRNNEDDQEDGEEDYRDGGCTRYDIPKAEYRSHDGDNKKYKSPPKHRCPLVRTVLRQVYPLAFRD